MSNMLYHYTNIDTLEKILANKTIRFSTLSLVDDMEEQITGNFGNFGRFAYTSSWTETGVEKYPLWKVYTQDISQGVRIGMPKNIFPIVKHPSLTSQQRVGLNPQQSVLADQPYTDGIKELEESENIYAMTKTVELFPVTYTEDPYLLKFPVLDQVGDITKINQSMIGRFKRKSVWEDQEEWRYKAFILPFTVRQVAQYQADGTIFKRIMHLKDDDIPFENFDLPIDSHKLRKMEIVTSCLMSDEDKERVRSIVDKFNSHAKVFRSKLTVRK